MSMDFQQIEDFLYHEAELLDEWKLEEWASLFSCNGRYLIPPIGNPDADTNQSLFYANDDRARLEQRAKRLLKKEAHVEYPHSSTTHNIHNIRIVKEDLENNTILVKCNFSTYRAKREVLDCFVGILEYTLAIENNEIKNSRKKSDFKT